MVDKKDLIADTTFYSCFLDCINDEKPLIKILESFKTHLSPILHKELSNSPNIHLLKDKMNIFHNFTNIGLDLSAAAKPFFSNQERDKGEAEILVLAYICYNMGMEISIIIDEISKKDLLLRLIPQLKNSTTGTISFIVNCVNPYNIFNKEEALELLRLIRPTKFRVPSRVIDEAEKSIKSLK